MQSISISIRRILFFALLIFEGLMLFFTFTYLRQVLAAGIIWFAVDYVVQRRFKYYLLLVIIATFNP